MELLDRMTAAIDGKCPCGAEPREGSAYCGDDCTPTHISDDTDTRQAGSYATPMRWRPDLVSAVDDSDLAELGSNTFYAGRHHAQLFQRGSEIDGVVTWHLRLDDGHRFVGCDLTGVRKIDINLEQRMADKWAALERELGDSRHVEPDPQDPDNAWLSQWMRTRRVQMTPDPWTVEFVAAEYRQTLTSVSHLFDRWLADSLPFGSVAGTVFEVLAFRRGRHRAALQVVAVAPAVRPDPAVCGAYQDVVRHFEWEFGDDLDRDDLPVLDSIISEQSTAELRKRAEKLVRGLPATLQLSTPDDVWTIPSSYLPPGTTWSRADANPLDDTRRWSHAHSLVIGGSRFDLGAALADAGRQAAESVRVSFDHGGFLTALADIRLTAIDQFTVHQIQDTRPAEASVEPIHPLARVQGRRRNTQHGPPTVRRPPRQLNR